MSATQTHLFYISIIIISTLFTVISERVRASVLCFKGLSRIHRVNVNKVFLYLIAILVLVIPLVEKNCGADMNSYYFNYIHERIGTTDASFGRVLVFLHRYITDPKDGYGIISSITIILSFTSLIKAKDYINVPLAFFSYVTVLYFYSYNYIRMMFAFSFIIMGYSLCIRNKRKIAIIPFLVAPLFHLSSVLVLLIHLALLNFRKHSKLVIGLGVLGLIAFMIMPSYFLSLITIERYQNTINVSQSSGIGVGTIIRALPILYILWTYREKFKIDVNYTWLIVFAFFNIAFSFLGYYVGSASRISNILLTFHVLFAVPYLTKGDDNQRRKSTSTYIFIGYCILMYVLNCLNFPNIGIVPYY